MIYMKKGQTFLLFQHWTSCMKWGRGGIILGEGMNHPFNLHWSEVLVFLIFFYAHTFRTYWLPFHGIEGFAWYRFLAIPANKAISMPLTVQSRDIILHNWPVTATTFWCKHIKIIIPTVWFAIPLMESFFPKLFSTLGTEKMFSVPSFFKCSNTFIKNRPIAVGTTRWKQVVVVRFTIRMAITLKKVASTQFLVAMSACKMLWVPSFSQCCYHLPNDGLITGVTAALLCGVNTLTAHVGLKIAKHRVQLVLFSTTTCRRHHWCS